MWKAILNVSLVLVMAISFTACAKEPSAQEIVDSVIESLDKIETYEFEMSWTLDQTGEVGGCEAIEETMLMDFNGALDIDNRQMWTDLTVSTAAPGEGETETVAVMERYFIDNIGYVMIHGVGVGQEPVWTKEEFSEADWEEITVLSLAEPQVELLQGAQVEVIGSDKVRGVDCYVLRLIPDMRQLWVAVMQGPSGAAETEVFELTKDVLNEVLCNYSVKQWITKDTYFLTKVEIDMSMEFTPEATMAVMGEEGEMIFDVAMIYLIYNYNQPVSIVLPPEAEEAIEEE
jgi:outer membrane lipoprotein-sorting protein